MAVSSTAGVLGAVPLTPGHGCCRSALSCACGQGRGSETMVARAVRQPSARVLGPSRGSVCVFISRDPRPRVNDSTVVQSIATGIEGLVCSKSSPYKLCTTSPIKLYHKRVSRTGSVFPIFRGYKLIDKPVQSLYGLVLQSRPHSIPVEINWTNRSKKKSWSIPLVINLQTLSLT